MFFCFFINNVLFLQYSQLIVFMCVCVRCIYVCLQFCPWTYPSCTFFHHRSLYRFFVHIIGIQYIRNILIAFHHREFYISPKAMFVLRATLLLYDRKLLASCILYIVAIRSYHIQIKSNLYSDKNLEPIALSLEFIVIIIIKYYYQTLYIQISE